MYLFPNPPSSRAPSCVQVERASLARGAGAACLAPRAPAAPAGSAGSRQPRGRPPCARGGLHGSPVTQAQLALQIRISSGSRQRGM